MAEIKDQIKDTIKSYEKHINDAYIAKAKAEARAEAYGCLVCELRDLLIQLEKGGGQNDT